MFARFLVDIEFFKPQKTSDAVLIMDHIIAAFDIHKAIDRRIGMKDVGAGRFFGQDDDNLVLPDGFAGFR